MWLEPVVSEFTVQETSFQSHQVRYTATMQGHLYSHEHHEHYLQLLDQQHNVQKDHQGRPSQVRLAHQGRAGQHRLGHCDYLNLIPE